MVNSLIAGLPKPKIRITNHSGYADGAGAQVQRILSLIAFARKHGIEFVLDPIAHVEIQPVDYLLDGEDLQENIHELNNWLINAFGIQKTPPNQVVFNTNSKTRLICHLIFLRIKSVRGNSADLHYLSLLDAYFETSMNPSTWSLIRPARDIDHLDLARTRVVHIHFRLSTFSFTSDRRVTLDYYRDVLHSIKNDSEMKGYNLDYVVHTDFEGSETPIDFFLSHAVPQSLQYWVKLGLLTTSYSVNRTLLLEARER